MGGESIWRENTTSARLARWEALWAMEELPRPLWFVPADAMLALPLEFTRKLQPVNHLFQDKYTQYEATQKFNRYYSRLQRWLFKDDYVIRMQPMLGIGVIASAFGSRIVFPENQYPMSHPVIHAGEPATRVYEFEAPAVDAGQLGQVLDFASYFNKQNGGKVPIALTDLQGPLDSAYLVWDTCDFMVALLHHPREVHHLMELVTDLIIRFVKEMRQRVDWFVPAHFPPIYLPDGKGITISEDVLAIISPKLYEEFSLPYINRLSEEFGGVFIHSCGNIEHQIPVLKKVHNLRGLNFGVNETRFEVIWKAFGGETVIVPHLSAVSIVANYKNAFDFVEHVTTTKTRNRGLAIMVAPDIRDIHAVQMEMALGKKIRRQPASNAGVWQPYP